MTMLLFLGAIATIAWLVLAIEGDTLLLPRLRRPAGLLMWALSGNWPAKIGGALIIVGSGALLRFGLLHFEAPPTLKLGGGVAIATLLALAGTLTRDSKFGRAASLALGGSAFGVAYLTAYSSFAFFGYVSDPVGIGLLVLTAIAAGLFAVTRRALSVALLAMVGAYLAPAFAVADPGPALVYGYYVAASALTLAMVAARGWRPLIHLSFLFTLIGSVTFAWLSKYYEPANFAVLAPMLLALVTLHIAMPLADRSGARRVAHLDVAYAAALPLVSMILSFVIAPTNVEFAILMMELGGLWLLAAALLRLLKRSESVYHAAIGALLAIIGLATRFPSWPWDVLALAGVVGALLVSFKYPKSVVQDLVAGAVLAVGAIHVIVSLGKPAHLPVLFNSLALERVIAAALLCLAGMLCRRSRHSLDVLFFGVAAGWVAVSVGGEIARWHVLTFELGLYLLALLVSLVFCLQRRYSDKVAPWTLLPVLALALATPWVAQTTQLVVSCVLAVLAPLTLLALAVRRGDTDIDGAARTLAVLGLPIVAGVWAYSIGTDVGFSPLHAPFTIAAIGVMVCLLAAEASPRRSAVWLPIASLAFGVAGAAVLGVTTLAHIARDPWAIGLEVATLCSLAMLVAVSSQRAPLKSWVIPALMLAGALVVQANLLRVLGPAGTLTIADVGEMRLPSVLSLVWVVMGTALTLIAVRRRSRSLWIAGATLLVTAAVKVVVVDFGALDEIENILSVIAAGAMFMLVGWLAPMPRAEPETDEAGASAATPAPRGAG
jgi:uncharacterized membrane protein